MLRRRRSLAPTTRGLGGLPDNLLLEVLAHIATFLLHPVSLR
jgi:hypothetical protein